MQADVSVPKTLAEMVAAAGIDEIDDRLALAMEGGMHAIDVDVFGEPLRLDRLSVDPQRYRASDVTCDSVPLGDLGLLRFHRGMVERRLAHLEEALAHIARPDVALPDGFIVLRDEMTYASGNTASSYDVYLALWSRDGRKCLMLTTSDEVFAYDSVVYGDMEDPESPFYGRKVDEVLSEIVACHALTVPIEKIRPDVEPDAAHLTVERAACGDDDW